MKTNEVTEGRTMMQAMWNGLAVVVQGATVYGQPAVDVLFAEGAHPVPDDEIMVRVAFCVAGPIGPNDAPWGPMSEATVPMSEIAGTVEWAGPGGLMTTLRA
jgi:hypothetical protein